MASRRFVLFARNVAGKFGKAVKEKLLMLSRRFVLFARNLGHNREQDNKGKLRPQFAWPQVVNSSPRNAWATRSGNLDLEPSAYTLASRLLQNSPLKEDLTSQPTAGAR